MGLKHSKIIPLPIPVVLKRITECHIPDDRNILLDLLEMLDINMCEEKDFEVNTRQLKESNGINVLMKVLKRMIEDVDLVFVGIQLVETIKFNTPIVMDFIQFGGLDFLEKANKVHADDEFISGSIPKLLKILVAIGAPASIQEINEETINLQLCQKCQETIELIKLKRFETKGIKIIPKSYERINRVLKFMDNFLVSKEVQIAGLNAILAFSRNIDAKTSIFETNIIKIIYKSLQLHIKEIEILWRVCMIYSIISTFSNEISYEIVHTGIHMIIINNYNKYKKLKNYDILQQMLWCMGSLLVYPASKKFLNKQIECMDFFKMIIQDFEDLKELMAKDPAAKKKGYKDDKLYLLAIPLSIRSFMRETAGKLAKEEQRKAERAAKRELRRNFDERPKFGTVQDSIYTPGEAGLIASATEDEEGNEKRKLPDWEQKLNAMRKQ